MKRGGQVEEKGEQSHTQRGLREPFFRIQNNDFSLKNVKENKIDE